MGYQFFENIKNIESNNFKIYKKYFDDESHGTVALQSWYYGFKALLQNE